MNKKELYIWASQMKYNIKRFLGITHYPHIGMSSRVGINDIVVKPDNLFLDVLSTLKRDDVIMNPRARFVMKKWSGAAEELMVITGNHMSVVGKSIKDVTDAVKDSLDTNNEFDKDVIVDEDVWMGARVTLLSGVHIGRGAEIGTGAVVRKSIPPYAVVVGNPAKIVGFRFTPEEIIEHEISLYKEEERLPISLLEKNYEKYYLSKIREIRTYLSLSC
jgi:acetyltransferase-like isoleucine patch superfamily enzyme